jgi:hypothetical protein
MSMPITITLAVCRGNESSTSATSVTGARARIRCRSLAKNRFQLCCTTEIPTSAGLTEKQHIYRTPLSGLPDLQQAQNGDGESRTVAISQACASQRSESTKR